MKTKNIHANHMIFRLFHFSGTRTRCNFILNCLIWAICNIFIVVWSTCLAWYITMLHEYAKSSFKSINILHARHWKLQWYGNHTCDVLKTPMSLCLCHVVGGEWVQQVSSDLVKVVGCGGHLRELNRSSFT